jgi:hypothetical protein
VELLSRPGDGEGDAAILSGAYNRRIMTLAERLEGKKLPVSYAGPYTKPDTRNRWIWQQEVIATYEPLPDVPPVSIDPASQSFGSAGGTGTIAVTVTGEGQSGTWTVDKDSEAMWMMVVSPTEPQTDDGTVNYLVDPWLPGSGVRTAHLYINGKTFTVTQTT